MLKWKLIHPKSNGQLEIKLLVSQSLDFVQHFKTSLAVKLRFPGQTWNISVKLLIFPTSHASYLLHQWQWFSASRLQMIRTGLKQSLCKWFFCFHPSNCHGERHYIFMFSFVFLKSNLSGRPWSNFLTFGTNSLFESKMKWL